MSEVDAASRSQACYVRIADARWLWLIVKDSGSIVRFYELDFYQFVCESHFDKCDGDFEDNIGCFTYRLCVGPK